MTCKLLKGAAEDESVLRIVEYEDITVEVGFIALAGVDTSSGQTMDGDGFRATFAIVAANRAKSESSACCSPDPASSK